jgi:hypothetical protein
VNPLNAILAARFPDPAERARQVQDLITSAAAVIASRRNQHIFTERQHPYFGHR